MTYEYIESAPPSDQRFALRLRQLRAAAGLTAQALASQARVDPGRYRAFEAGQAPVTAAALMRLAQALRLDLAIFFDPD